TEHINVTQFVGDARSQSAHITDPLGIKDRAAARFGDVLHKVLAAPTATATTAAAAVRTIAPRARPGDWQWKLNARPGASPAARPRTRINTAAAARARIAQAINQHVGFGDDVDGVIVAGAAARRVFAIRKEDHRLAPFDAAQALSNDLINGVIDA